MAELKDAVPVEYPLVGSLRLQPYLTDDDVTEVLILGPGAAYIVRRGRLEHVSALFGSEQALQAEVNDVARRVGHIFDKHNPRFDARLPDGSRIQAWMPPLSLDGTTVAIRRFTGTID